MNDVRSTPTIKLTRHSCVLWIIGLSAAVIVSFRLVHFFFPPPEIPLIASAPGLEISARIPPSLPLALPTDTRGASIQITGYYTQDAKDAPAGTVHIVYAKKTERVFELMVIPVRAKDPILHAFTVGRAGPRIAIGGNEGRIYDMRRLSPTCVDITPRRPIGVCQITRRLLFERGETTYVIAVDGNHLTEGELIQIARSIPDAAATNIPFK